MRHLLVLLIVAAAGIAATGAPWGHILDRELQSNAWYQKLKMAAGDITNESCYVCSRARLFPIVVPLAFNGETCAEYHLQHTPQVNHTCRANKTAGEVCEENANEIEEHSTGHAVCPRDCMLQFGSPLANYTLLEQWCDKKVMTLLKRPPGETKGPPVDYVDNSEGPYECFGRMHNTWGYNCTGSDNSNGCNFDQISPAPHPHAHNMGIIEGKCKIIWMVREDHYLTEAVHWGKNGIKAKMPMNPWQTLWSLYPAQNIYLRTQTRQRADIYWKCGPGQLHQTLPRNWTGLCALVMLAEPMDVMAEKSFDLLRTAIHTQWHHMRTTGHRVKRNIGWDKEIFGSKTYIDAIGVPRGVPDEYKAVNQIKAGFASILPWVQINKNVDWINYVYYNQQRLANYSKEALTALGQQLAATSLMALQNRIALDMLLAEKDGVCTYINQTDTCCTFIPNNTAPNGSFTRAMKKLDSLTKELKAHAGVDTSGWSWFDSLFKRWWGKLIQLAMVVVTVLGGLALIGCCIIPCVRSLITRSIEKSVQTQMVRMPLLHAEGGYQEYDPYKDQPDLFPFPDYFDGDEAQNPGGLYAYPDD